MQQSKPREIFRKAALDNLSSPDQLDLLMEITTPKGWLVLFTLSSIVVLAMLWSIFGSISTKITAQGMLSRVGGIYEISTSTQGRVLDMQLKVGDIVHQGDIIARIDQPDLKQQIKVNLEHLVDLKLREESYKKFAEVGEKLQRATHDVQRHNLIDQIDTGKTRMKILSERMADQEELVKQGLLTKQQLLTTKMDLDNFRERVADAENQIKQLEVRRLDTQKQDQSEHSTLSLQIAETEREIETKQLALTLSENVYSPYDGRIIEIRAGNVGSLVGLGTTILTLERMDDLRQNANNSLEVVMFAPATEGKNVEVGMDVQISPSNIKREKSGFMIGRVRWVADYPASQQGIMRVLQNEKLVEQLSANGAPIEIRVDILPDATSPNGYKWSSGKGPNHSIDSGTLCAISVVTERYPPITLVMPALKKYLGLL